MGLNNAFMFILVLDIKLILFKNLIQYFLLLAAAIFKIKTLIHCIKLKNETRFVSYHSTIDFSSINFRRRK